MRRTFGRRAQAESIGVVLLLGVVVVSVGAFGAFYLTDGFAGGGGSGGAGGAAGGSVNVQGDVSYDRLELAHAGGRSLPAESLRVVVRNASGETEYDFDPALLTGGDGDATFEAGEEWRLAWDQSAGEELRVSVVDTAANSVLFSETLTVPATATPEPDEPARGETPTATATPEPEGTATPADPNDPPAADARGGTVRGEEGESLTLDGSGTTDPDGDSLTYEWRVADGDGLPPDAARIVEDSTATPNATFEVRENVTDRNYSLTVELVVSDGSDSVRDAATVDVEKLNRPPVADAGEDAEMVVGDGGRERVSVESTTRPVEPAFAAAAGRRATVGAESAVAARWGGGGRGGSDDDRIAAVTLDGSESYDPDGDDLTYEWEIVGDGGLGDGLELSDADAVRPTLSLTDAVTDRDRDVTVRLTVTDDDGATDTDTVNVSVAAVDRDDHDRYHGWVPGWLAWLLHLLFGWL